MIQPQRVRDLSKYARIQFHNQIIENLKNTVYPASYTSDKESVIKALEERIDDILRDKA